MSKCIKSWLIIPYTSLAHNLFRIFNIKLFSLFCFFVSYINIVSEQITIFWQIYCGSYATLYPLIIFENTSYPWGTFAQLVPPTINIVSGRFDTTGNLVPNHWQAHCHAPGEVSAVSFTCPMRHSLLQLFLAHTLYAFHVCWRQP